MNGVIILILIGFVAVCISLTAKFLLKIMNRFEAKHKAFKNPYIQYHKFKETNDGNYEDYLNWLDKKGEGIPVDKYEMPEDKRVNQQIKKLL